FDGSIAHLMPVRGDLFLDRVGNEGGKQSAAPGENAKQGTQRRSAQDWCNHAATVLTRRPKAAYACHGPTELVFSGKVPDDLADAEHADRNGREFEAVEELSQAVGEAGCSGVDIRSCQAEKQAKADHSERLQQ